MKVKAYDIDIYKIDKRDISTRLFGAFGEVLCVGS